MKIHTLVLFSASLTSHTLFAADEIHWTINGSTSVTFDWRGSNAEDSIRYRTASGSYGAPVQAETPDPQPTSSSGPFWEATISGLQKNTRYYYSIGDGPEHSFRTPQSSGGADFTVYAVGDIGSTRTYSKVGAVQKIIGDVYGNGFPQFVLMIGDLSYADIHGTADVDQHFNDVMRWSQDAAYMPAWGNHEWHTSSDSPDDFYNYLGRFNVPNGHSSPGTSSVYNYAPGEDWYWFDYGNARFISYPQDYSSSTLSDWNQQVQSIMKDAQSASKISFIVTFGHSPAYSSTSSIDKKLKGYLDGLGQLYPKYKLNICGHHHHYERSDPTKTFLTHIVVGTGHSNFAKITTTQPSWSMFRTVQTGALKLRFVNSSQGPYIEGQFICAPTSSYCDKAGKVLDSFKIKKP